jgi:hypothetical protein
MSVDGGARCVSGRGSGVVVLCVGGAMERERERERKKKRGRGGSAERGELAERRAAGRRRRLLFSQGSSSSPPSLLTHTPFFLLPEKIRPRE